MRKKVSCFCWFPVDADGNEGPRRQVRSRETINLSRKATMRKKEEREMKFFLLSVSPRVNPSYAFLFNVEEST